MVSARLKLLILGIDNPFSREYNRRRFGEAFLPGLCTKTRKMKAAG